MMTARCLGSVNPCSSCCADSSSCSLVLSPTPLRMAAAAAAAACPHPLRLVRTAGTPCVTCEDGGHEWGPAKGGGCWG
eukprot:1138018-Pelagomonas_calceolata.AAC.2